MNKNYVRKLAYLTILAIISTIPSVSVVFANGQPRPVANVSFQAVGPVGIWFGGVIYSDGTANGGGSICHVEELEGLLGFAEVYLGKLATNMNSWDPSTGTLTVWPILTNPLTGATFGPFPFVTTGLSEGHNEIIFEGSLHIVEIHSIP